jgi:FkbM family methyltransferase
VAKDLSWLTQAYRPDVLIDIGANDGAYGSFLQKQFGAAIVHAFEPLPQHASDLLDRGFVLHPVALADQAGEAEFYINGYAPASSLLPLTDLCIQEYPQTARVTASKVRLARLDDELPDPPANSLVKIDAQGCELPIIRGGRTVLSAAQVILIEMTFQPLYKGQALFNEVHAELDAIGFEFTGVLSQSTGQSSTRPLFAHCVYEKCGCAPREGGQVPI